MIDFSKYNLQELQAMSDLLDYLREDAGADSLSYFCGCSLLQAIKHESLRLSRSILMSLEEQAVQAERPNAPELTVLVIPRKPLKLEPQDLRKFEELYNDHAAAEAEKVATAPPAEEPDDLQALVDTLSRCSDQLAALALVEDRHFAESSQMEDFLRVSVLRNGNRAVMDLAAEIRDRYYDRLH